MQSTTDYDAIIVGSGPNGLAAAILMQQQGLSVLLMEGKDTIGGGMRSAELTLPGYVHDVCSAIHPLAAASPFLSTLPLHDFGLEYIHPTLAGAHPFDDGTAAICNRSLTDTAKALGIDEGAYLKLMQPLVQSWARIVDDALGPLGIPKHPLDMARFGWSGLPAATTLMKRFETPQAKSLLMGMAAHAMQPLTNLTTSAFALVLLTAAHLGGWPIPKGGSQSIANAMAGYFISLGGKIETGFYVTSLEQLPSAKAILFDVTPRQLLQIAGHKFSSIYKWQLERYRYGMGVFKIDWALAEPIPFTNTQCRTAGTVHLGGNYTDIIDAEQRAYDGRYCEKPFVLLAQQSLFDPTRAPQGKHTGWGYCHVPNGSTRDMTAEIENQVERFAPGFKERILARHTMNNEQVQEYNPNYIGGDIGGGIADLGQLFTRPALRLSPYRTSAKGLYICSSSTPPGGGVHGMCGYHAAKRALRDVFNVQI
jgi:phytoene dehydrogenase-like protein